MTRKITPSVLAIAIVCFATAIALAQTRDTAAEAQQIYTNVMSPFCPGLLLADCPSPAAFDLRADIRRRLEAGESPAAIERDLYKEYGDAIRAIPPARGAGRVLWVAPAIVLVLSFAGLLVFLARQRATPESPRDTQRDAAMDERLEHELDDML